MITSGCTATTFCPNQVVTRAQMAAFLARALELRGRSFFNLGQSERADADFEELIRLQVDYRLDRETISPKVIARWEAVRARWVGTVGIEVEPVGAEIRIDGDFHENSTEGVHGKSLRLVAGLHIGRSFDGHSESAQGLRDIVGAAAGDGVLTRLSARGLHGAANARHCHRAAMRRRLRQPVVTERELHPLDRQTESVRGHLGHGRPGARSHVARTARDLGGAVRP